ncbi:Ldh family oxidoreductase [Consotaella aegiceratis]|uniref:Ldh family oxidoreductase n=1 Tax=Consotaella aegiceratis TaxID=3097961 RepID=UPI002F41520E
MRLSLADAEALVGAALERVGTAPAAARSVAAALVNAEAAGQSGHGLRRVVIYAAQVSAGKVDGRAGPSFERIAPGVLRIDAHYGFAYPALDLAVGELPALVREQGVAVAAIRRSHHAGVLGLTVERFAQVGLVALMVANAPAAMAPWGGRLPLFGTNPLAFAAPVAHGDPVVVDLSLSKVARGKVMAARQKGVPIPEGWAFDRDGNPTTDPDAAIAGTMAPMGDAKGAALALMVEMLAAGVTGAQFGFEADSLLDAEGSAPALGHLILALDPERIGGPGAVERLAAMAAAVAAQEGARIPGRRGQELRRQAETQGIDIEDDVLATIRGL